MKKNLIICLLMTFAFSLTFGLTSCKSCSGNEATKKDGANAAAMSAALNVENVISTDRETMFLKAGDNVRWYETTIMLNDYMSESECTGEVDAVVNTFQKITQKDHGYDTMVYSLKHYKDGTYEIDSVAGWWAEDFPLNDEVIKINFKDAFELLMNANIVKPYSKYCVIRKEVGPNICNPQYIFGNIHNQVYVDAVTGNVTSKNPVYDGCGFGKPLGEWP